MTDISAHQRARYDDDGNIVIEGDKVESKNKTNKNYDKLEPQDDEIQSQVYNKTEYRVSEAVKETQSTNTLEHDKSYFSGVTYAVLQEGRQQYLESILETKNIFTKFCESARRFQNKMAVYMAQPVWVIKKKAPKQYSRFTLFISDTIRFGATFAFLFVLLFASLNYKSYWQIASSHLNPLQYKHDQLQNSLSQTIHQKLLKAPNLAVAGQDQENLINYLPPVGPPGKRLIIPKLGINVPIIVPPIDSLLQEDWGKLEEDIQLALRDGVVHYPGTAKPGLAGNFFLTGHSSYYPFLPGNYKDVFARLHEMNIGDEYLVYYNGDAHRYRITNIEEVKPSNVNVLDQPIDKFQSTLMTCTPIGTTYARLIVTAFEVDMLTGDFLTVGQTVVKDYPKIDVRALPI